MKFPNGHVFDDDEINALRSAFSSACEELRISDTDAVSRDRVGVMVISLARSGPSDAEELKAKAVTLFRDSSY